PAGSADGREGGLRARGALRLPAPRPLAARLAARLGRQRPAHLGAAARAPRCRAGMIGSLARRAYGNAVIARHLRGQTAIPYQDDASLRRLRDARVSAMVAHAAASVPYYRD